MNLSNYKEVKPHRVKRIIWALINASLFRLAGGRIGWPVRRGLLMIFGAEVDRQAYIYSRCKIFAPWMLTVGRACIGPKTEIYNKAKVTIGNDTVVSQGAFLCTASHDISSLMLPLTTAEIRLGDNVWVAANAFIGPGVTIGNGAVVGATSSVFKSVDPYMVVGGNPARPIHSRIVKSEDK